METTVLIKEFIIKQEASEDVLSDVESFKTSLISLSEDMDKYMKVCHKDSKNLAPLEAARLNAYNSYIINSLYYSKNQL